MDKESEWGSIFVLGNDFNLQVMTNEQKTKLLVKKNNDNESAYL